MGDNQIQDMSKMVGGTQRLAAARLHSSGDWWCTCECCAPVPTEEECLCCKKWDRLQPYFQGLDVTEDETPPPGVVSSWALSRARETYFGRTLESRARGINKHGSTPVRGAAARSSPTFLHPCYFHNRFTEDTIAHILHTTLSHLEKKENYVSLLFIDDS
ncbi:uncharacterized protein LOC144465062 isoform X2 [Epinephelus lanceolatus]